MNLNTITTYLYQLLTEQLSDKDVLIADAIIDLVTALKSNDDFDKNFMTAAALVKLRGMKA